MKVEAFWLRLPACSINLREGQGKWGEEGKGERGQLVGSFGFNSLFALELSALAAFTTSCPCRTHTERVRERESERGRVGEPHLIINVKRMSIFIEMIMGHIVKGYCYVSIQTEKRLR